MKIKIGIVIALTLSTGFLNAQEAISIEGAAQGTTYHITYYDGQFRNYQAEIDSILQDFDNSVSTYNPNSIISKINRNEKNVKVDKYFIACFNKAKEVWKDTRGAFDPTVYPLVNAWGFGPGKKQKLDKTKIDSILKFVGFDLIQLKGEYVVKKDPRMALDFNAFAQGYSVDVIARYLDSKGFSSYLVEIGGEVFAKGKMSDGQPWTVGIEEPYDNNISSNPLKAIAVLENRAVATSGNYRKYYVENGVKYAHHLDPKTGYPAKNNLLSVSVFAPTCITADANATGILVMGMEEAKKFLLKHKELMIYLIYSDEKGNYQVFQSPGLKDLIREAGK